MLYSDARSYFYAKTQWYSSFNLFTKRSSRPEVFCKKGSLRPATLLKKRLWHKCFLVNFAKFLRAPFIIEHLWTTPCLTSQRSMKIQIWSYSLRCPLVGFYILTFSKLSIFCIWTYKIAKGHRFSVGYMGGYCCTSFQDKILKIHFLISRELILASFHLYLYTAIKRPG